MTTAVIYSERCPLGIVRYAYFVGRKDAPIMSAGYFDSEGEAIDDARLWASKIVVEGRRKPSLKVVGGAE